MTLGFVDLLRDDFIEKIVLAVSFHSGLGIYARCYTGGFRGIHVWHMPALTEIFGDDSVLQFGGGTLGHPWEMHLVQ